MLQEIEECLAAEDSQLASVLRQPVRSQRWVRRGIDATIAVSVILAVVCLVLPGAATLGPGLTAVVLAMVMIVGRRRRFPPRAKALENGTSRTVWRGRRSPSP